MRDQHGSGDGKRPEATGPFGHLGERLEEALDRVSDAVERKMERLERKLADAYEGEVRGDGRDGLDQGEAFRDPEPGYGAAPEAGEPPAGKPGFASRVSRGYAAIVEKARSGVSGAVSKGAAALDDAAGESPWRMAGLDGRRTRIAREVMREVVPKVAGDRVASVMDGAAMKGGVAGVGLLLRIPLKGFAVPFLLGITAVETVRAVREVKESVADVAARVDNEARSEEAYRTGATGA